MKEHPYKKLEKDYHHCITRMIDLFAYGRKREYALETGVVNAQKYFEIIREMTDDKNIIDICDKMSSFMKQALESHPYDWKLAQLDCLIVRSTP